MDEDRRHFTKRLEAFSDIVFGFALAQSAFTLEVPKSIDDIGTHADDLIYFVITFGLIASFWLMHYRVFRYLFAARATDIVLNFMLLGAVALLPYAFRLYIRFPQSVLGSVAYAFALGGGFALLAMLEIRGLRDRDSHLTVELRAKMRGVAARHGAVGVVFLCSVPLFWLFGNTARFEWSFAGPAMFAAKWLRRDPLPAAESAPPAIEA